MSEIIAATQIECIPSSGQRFRVSIEVKRPYQTQTGEWACPITIQGLHNRLHDVRGEDSLQALCLALSLARQLLGHFTENGGRIVIVDTDQDYPIDSVFSGVGKASD